MAEGSTSRSQGAFVAVDEEKFEALLVDVRERAGEFHENRRVTHDVVEEFQALGLYRAFVPDELGGSGMHPSTFLRLIERIAEADGSAGWVASFGFATKYLSSLPAETLRTIYADGPDIVFSGAVFPPQTAKKVDGGVIVNGRWSWGSGCTSASLIGVGIKVEGGKNQGLPLMAVMPADKVRIDETWNAIGMCGTGSHDIVVEDVFVPDEWMLVRGAPASIHGPGYDYPSLAMAAQVLAVCGLGIANAAINHILSVAKKSKSITGAPSLGDRANVQLNLARAQGELQAARALFYKVTDDIWETLLAGREVTNKQKSKIRLSASHAAKTGADVARACFEMAGTMGVLSGHPLGRYMADAQVVAQHAFLTEGTWMSAGRVMFDLEPFPGYF